MGKSTEEFFDRVVTVKSDGHSCVDIIDQTLLPNERRRVRLHTKEEVWEAIKKLRVRGAPAIGVAAAFGMATVAGSYDTGDREAFDRRFGADADYLATSRPTAVNLFWALDRMRGVLSAHPKASVDEVKDLLWQEADKVREEDVAISRAIGKTGFAVMERLRRPGHVLGVQTHCNAGTLATAKYGTATAPVYTALEHGWSGDDMHVYCDETRPLLQGARLTAFELVNAGVATTLQCDDMASALMAAGKVDVVFVGCDRVAANGDAANKIGTSTLAIVAHHYHVPFYVCAPTSTIDMATATGADIPIEMRDADEVTEMWYKRRMAPEGVDVFNPAFDVTDAGLITGIITERGMCHAPYGEAFKAIGMKEA